jgi:ankyrin repeat protein
MALDIFSPEPMKVSQAIIDGWSVDYQDDSGYTALHHAVLRDDPLMIDYLARRDAQLLTDNHGRSPMAIAAQLNKRHAIRALLDCGYTQSADVSMVPALIMAVNTGNQVIGSLLLNHEIDLRSDKNGDSALHHAVATQQGDMVDLLISHNYPIKRNHQGFTPTYIAVRIRDYALTEKMVAYEGVEDPHLLAALLFGSFPKVFRHLKSGASVTGSLKDGTTALHVAIARGSTLVLDKLVRAGADINAVDQLGNTPCQRAVYAGNTDMTEHLINLGADITIENQVGERVAVARLRKDRPELFAESA